MTARTRAIERKLVEWFSRHNVRVDDASCFPTIYLADRVISRERHTPVKLSDLATAIELGEIS
jgi:hypothetical protein